MSISNPVSFSAIDQIEQQFMNEDWLTRNFTLRIFGNLDRSVFGLETFTAWSPAPLDRCRVLPLVDHADHAWSRIDQDQRGSVLDRPDL